uniref:Uncharacterized protein n=1 Tax=Avena sativa TaxID=4498 RepID=A0ACD5U205_AVESA
MFVDDTSETDCATGGEEDNDAITNNMIVGIMPTCDTQGDEGGSVSETNNEKVQGEFQGIPNEALQWPKPNEDRQLQVYSRRHRTGQEQVQVEEIISDSSQTSSSSTNDVPVPHDWQEAKQHPEWRMAMLEEMQALDKNNTWVLTTLPPNKKVVGCKWVFTIKHNSEGKVESGKITILVVYVDDIVITGNDDKEISHLKKMLSKSFEVKDLGYLHYFLGIEVAYGTQGICLSQRKYVLDLLAETGMLECRPAITPIESNHRILAESGDPVDKHQYQRLVGRLIYLSHTRPDISYAVSVVSRYMHDPRRGHLDAVNRILRYLKTFPGKGILFSRNGHLNIEGYRDADWVGCLDDRKSTSGYCVFVGGNLVSWRSKKQNVVSRSTAEAEFRAMASGLCELMWLRILLMELGLFDNAPLQLYCDNQATISLVNNPVHHDRTKHIEIDRHFIKEKIDEGLLQFLSVSIKMTSNDSYWIVCQFLELCLFTNGCSNKDSKSLQKIL